MKIQSMTGFGKAQNHTNAYSCRIEIKTVNNRFLDLQFKGPKETAALEQNLRNILNTYVARGSVTCFIQYINFEKGPTALKINQRMVSSYKRVINDLQKQFSAKPGLDISELLKIPDLISNIPESENLKTLGNRIFPVFETACKALVKMRESEGTKLIRDINGRMLSLRKLSLDIKKQLPDRQKEYLARTKQRIEQLTGDPSILDDSRLVTELSIISERLDVTEEIVRLEAHIEAFKNILSTQSTPGKKLGFILQEMLRETNTLSTKSLNSVIQHICVDIKEILEIIREQVQNIE